MKTILDWLLSSEGAQPAPVSPVWYVLGCVILVLAALAIIRLVFIFSVSQKSTGFMLLGNKLKRENLAPGWYAKIPFLYVGVEVYLGLKTLAFEEETRSADLVNVIVRGALQFKVVQTHAALYYFGVADSDRDTVILERVLSAMRSAVSSQPAKESFEHKDAIATRVTESIKDGLLRDLGIEVVDVPIKEVAPHKDVAAAFNAVQAAQRKVDEAIALAKVKRTDAEGDADAMSIRAGGQTAQLQQQAFGILDMLTILTGKELTGLPLEGAVFVMNNFLGLQMRQAFAENGSTAMIIPDDREVLAEMTSLLPTLLMHSAVDGETIDESEKLLKLMDERVGNDTKAKEKLAAFREKAKASAHEIADDAIGELPKFLQPFAKRIRDKARRKLTYGQKAT